MRHWVSIVFGCLLLHYFAACNVETNLPPSPLPAVINPSTLKLDSLIDANDAAIATALYGNHWLSGPEVVAAEMKALKGLRTSLTLVCDNQPLEKVLNFLTEETKLNISPNWKAMESAAIHRQTPVTVQLKEVLTWQALDHVLSNVGDGNAGLGWQLDRGIITISTRDDLNSQKYQSTLVYDVNQLLRQLSDQSGNSQEDTIKSLQHAITSAIAPDTWRDNGGTVGSLRETGGFFIIHQTTNNHRDIIKLLNTMQARWAVKGPQSPTKKAPRIEPAQGVLKTAAFATDLYQQIAQAHEGNFVCSPLSINAAMSMTYGGARNRTAEQIRRTLRHDEPAEKVHAAFAGLLDSLDRVPLTRNSEGKEEHAYELAIANAVWAQKGLTFDQTFMDTLKNAYSAAAQETDFETQGDAGRVPINTWVAKRTKGRIKEIVPPDVVTRDTRLVLVNAIYFKAGWEIPFNENATKEEDFQITPEKVIRAKMMHKEDTYSYTEDDDIQLLELPYRKRAMSMVVLLPRKVDGLAELEKKLTVENLREWMGSKGGQRVNVSLPKFSIETNMQLNKTLAAMGMPDAFDPSKADFSGVGQKDLYLTAVLHKAVIDVDEQGTEAAATTVAVGGLFGESPSKKVKTFKADRPFIYLIRHNQTGEILFIGRVVNPSAK